MARSTTTTARTPSAGTKSKATAAPKRISRIPAPPVKLVPERAEPDAAAVSGPDLKKQELIQKVFERTDIKKKDVKPVAEALLEILGEALAEGRELNLPPLGKLKINRVKDTAAARIIIAKIRQGKTTGANAAKPDADPLAALAE